MSNTYVGNVVRVDTTADFPNIKRIRSIKYIGNTSATKGEVIITKATAAGDNSGGKLWDNGNATTADVTDVNVDIKSPTGVHVVIGAHSAVLYLYVE